MRKPLGQMGGVFARSLLRAATLLLLFSSALSQAQCGGDSHSKPTFRHVSDHGEQGGLDQWQPGKSYEVFLKGSWTDPPQPPGCTTTVVTVLLSDGSYDLGNEDPNVAVSNVVTTNKGILFTVTISANAPTETDLINVTCVNGSCPSQDNMRFHVVIGPLTPPPPPPPPPACSAQTITSVIPSDIVAGKTNNLTITGTGFLAASGDPEECASKAVSMIYLGDTNRNPLDDAENPYNYDIISITATTIVATAQLPASAPIGPATLYLLDYCDPKVDNPCVDGSPGFVSAPVNIVCPQPKVTSLLPKTWFAGKSYTVKILGTGFNPTAASGCPVTPVVAKTAKGSIPLSGVTVVSATEINATVTPDASEPTELAAITVGSSSTGQQSIRTQILGNQILLNGNPVSAPNAPPPVVVGQQIVLTTTMPTTTWYDGATTPQPWTVGGTRIAGYKASTAGASVTKLADADLQKNTVTFYWVNPGSATVTHPPYCVEIQGANPVHQCSLEANAVFNVDGVGSPSISFINEKLVTIDNLDACNGIAGGPYLVYGNITGPHTPCTGTGKPGIQFFPQGTPPGSGNRFFVQIVNHDVIDQLGGSPSQSCTTSSGVDGQYPYQGQLNPTSVPDAPEWALSDAFPILTRNFNASMYLFWQSTDTANSIPVPLGYIPWAFYGSAQKAGGSWSGGGEGAPIGTGGNPFVPVETLSDFPTWGGPAETVCTAI